MFNTKVYTKTRYMMPLILGVSNPSGKVQRSISMISLISLSSTPSLVPVNLARSSGIPVHTGHYLGDMLRRDGNSSEFDMLVANGTCATIEVHPIVLRFPQFARLRPLPKIFLKKRKTAAG